jgi:hypothetical protein
MIGHSINLPALTSFGGGEFVCQGKSEDRESGQQDADVNVDSNVHVDDGSLLTDTIQHLLYAEAQSTQAGNNGWHFAASELGEGISESLHLHLPQLS